MSKQALEVDMHGPYNPCPQPLEVNPAWAGPRWATRSVQSFIQTTAAGDCKVLRSATGRCLTSDSSWPPSVRRTATWAPAALVTRSEADLRVLMKY